MALAYQYRQTLNLASDVPVALWGIGVYLNDDWRVKSNLKITLGLRIERNSNPVCQFNCFADFKGPFSSSRASPVRIRRTSLTATTLPTGSIRLSRG